MENDRFKKRIRRVASVSIVILLLYLVLPLSLCAGNFCAGFADGFNSAESPGKGWLIDLILLLMLAVAGIGAVIDSLRLLFSMRKGETPFTVENGRRIGRTGVLLMVLEPLLMLEGLVSEGEFPSVYGISFAAGLIMCNVALLFGYGAHLQQESDETL